MIFSILDIILIGLGIFAIICVCAKWHYGYFERRGVKSIEPEYPFLGNIWEYLPQKEHIAIFMQTLYNAFPNERYVGYFKSMKTFYMVRDLQLIRKIDLEDFDCFVDRSNFIDKEVYSFIEKNRLTLKGHEWQDARAAFRLTSMKSKLNDMFPLIEECSEKMSLRYLKKATRQKSMDYIEVKLRHVSSKYAKNEENKFYLLGKKMKKNSVTRLLKMISFQIMPRLFKYFNVTFFKKKVIHFFKNIIHSATKKRKKSDLICEDMIYLWKTTKEELFKFKIKSNNIKEIRNQRERKNWNDNEMTTRALSFLIHGFETASVLLSFLAYELTINEDIQKKLQKEVDECKSKSKKKLSYIDIQNMKYMDMVISETLRLWPPIISTDRICVESYSLPPPNDTIKEYYKLKPGDALLIPIHAIHRDPSIYINPELFDPERFSDENRSSVHPYGYIPFGIGLRSCIGSHFAIMEVKTVIFHLLSNFDFVKIEKTQVPLQLSKNGATIMPLDGFWVGLKPRNSKN